MAVGIILRDVTAKELGVSPAMFAMSLWRRVVREAIEHPEWSHVDIARHINIPGVATDIACAIVDNEHNGRADYEFAAEQLHNYCMQERLTEAFVMLAKSSGTVSHRLSLAKQVIEKAERLTRGKRHNSTALDASGAEATTGKEGARAWRQRERARDVRNQRAPEPRHESERAASKGSGETGA